tara:strand:+ start:194 stop:1000 length:807 start_codon:yes stop_codon:yes gene_type:complete
MNIAILGAGWLGSVLAEKYIENNHNVIISTTSSEKQSLFFKKGLNTMLIEVTKEKIIGDYNFFNGIDLLIITIPPMFRKNRKIKYVEIMERIIEKIVSFGIKKVIYTSSTSVYGFQKNTIIEKSKTDPLTDTAKKILLCEKKLLENSSFESCIIRMGGLIGPNRHPIFSLSGKQNLPDPKSPINFIHQKDAVGITLFLSEEWNGNEIFNAVTPYHPSRKDYYTNISKIAKVDPPKFEKKGKIRGEISSSKLLKLTNYRFEVENLLILN